MVLSVVIVAFNNEKELPLAIKAIQENTQYPELTEIIVVDNSPENPSTNNLVEAPVKIKIINSSSNTYFTGGCNLGAKQSVGEIIVFTQPDGELQPGWDGPIRQSFSDQSIAAVAGLVLKRDRSQIDSAGIRIAPNLAGWSMQENDPPKTAAKRNGEDLVGASPAFMAVRRSAHFSINGFWEDLSIYGDEPDYALRIRQKGRIIFVPESVMVHFEGASAGPRRSQLRNYFSARNRILNCFRHLPLKKLPAGIALSLAFDFLIIAQSRQPASFLVVARGWRDGFSGALAARRLGSKAERDLNNQAISSFREALAQQLSLLKSG